MNIPINHEYRISSDVNQWMVQKLKWRKNKSGERVEEWVSFLYSPDLEGCVNGLFWRLLRLEEGNGIGDYRVARDSLVAVFRGALTPEFTVRWKELEIKE